MKTLKVTYDGGVIDRILDGQIEDFFELKGFVWYASGMEAETGIRDICFDISE